ncbi:thiol reductase thioredoxin [Nocardioides phosphati]|uniref:Thiol reductase thioredoxin n=1 Tax=Nocardioides phosphati TaxID=1867775 RepID=A0ABQ2NDA7_9ACTN|nr:thioredoxin family protein [Nocardioides phosphati]GGO93618.1 thiol reductase thioredoxin [Nocardioides phosphati]
MHIGQAALLVAVGGALVFGLWRFVTDGRFRGTHRVRGADSAEPEIAPLDDTAIAHRLGERATLLQFSSAFCAPCRATRAVLEDVARTLPGVEHVEIDAEHHLDLVRRLGVMRTPTTIVLDRGGREVVRAQGVPTRGQVSAVIP